MTLPYMSYMEPPWYQWGGKMTGLSYKCEKKEFLLCFFVSIICDLISVRVYVQT